MMTDQTPSERFTVRSRAAGWTARANSFWAYCWPVFVVPVVTACMVVAGPLWSLSTAAVAAVLLIIVTARLSALELTILTVPLSFYIHLGGVLVNFTASDIVFMIIVARLLIDPEFCEAFTALGSLVKKAVLSLGVLLASCLGTVIVGSLLGQAPDPVAFLADAIKLVIVYAYFVACLAYFAVELLRRNFRFLRLWSLAAAVSGMLGSAASLLYERGVDIGMSLEFRAMSTFEDPNAYASYLLLSLPIIMAANHLSGRRILSWHLVPVLGGVYFSFSRGGLIGLVLLVVSLFVFSLWDKRLRAVRIGSLVVIILAGTVIADGLTSAALGDRSGQVSFEKDVRFVYWQAAIELWHSSPVFGVGLGQFINYSKPLIGPNTANLAHNTYLSVLAETGMVGVVLFAVVPFVAVRVLFRRADTVARLLLCSAVASGVMALSLNLQNFRPLWMLLALALAWCSVPRCELDSAEAGGAAETPNRPETGVGAVKQN